MSFHQDGGSYGVPEGALRSVNGRNDPSNEKAMPAIDRREVSHRSLNRVAAPGEPSVRVTAFERFVIRRLLHFTGDPHLAIVFGDEAFEPAKERAAYFIRILDRSTLYKLYWDPEYWFFEGYSQGTIEISGELVGLLNTLKRRFSLNPQPVSTFEESIRKYRRHRRGRLRQGNVAYHYDLGNDFYRLWLDDQLLYTCAYFESDSLSLEAAQIAKMDYVCRKLRLRPGERVIEAGCGWGALALHMARHYGVHVRAFNLSQEQLTYARDRAKHDGLATSVEFIEADWSEITGSCDAFVSVGMLEHVGPENYPHLGRVICNSLVPSGRGLIHTIGQNTPEPLSSWIEQRIFPGAQPPTLQQMLELFTPYNLSVLDVENLRSHYAETLRHWLLRFEQSADVIVAMFDERFVRTWRIYLASSLSAFEVGSLQLYQVLFEPTGANSLPATRIDLYCEEHRPAG